MKLCSIQIRCHIHVQDKVSVIARGAITFCVLELARAYEIFSAHFL
jgi:hypothetical protein